MLFNFEIFTSPVRFHVAPSSTITSALLSTAVPFSELSTIFTVPLNSVEPDNVNFNVEIVSTSILPSSFWSFAVKVTFPPLDPAVPQPCEASFPNTAKSLPSLSLLTILTFSRAISLVVFVTYIKSPLLLVNVPFVKLNLYLHTSESN